MLLGPERYTYEYAEKWDKLPDGWAWGWVPAVACDSQDRVFVNSRSEHPLVVLDREGNYLDAWGEGILTDGHGLFIDADDNVYCTEWRNHCVQKFNSEGKLVMTLGTPGRPGEKEGDPFNLPTDVAVASTGEIFISDGYNNARVHKYSPDGELLFSWGEHGDGPGQFNCSHCVRVDKQDHVWVCDRHNDRIQIFDLDGNFLTAWTGLLRPDTICFDPDNDIVYIAELQYQMSIYTLEGELITKWGGAQKSENTGPGEFKGYPHGLWVDSHGDLYVGQVYDTYEQVVGQVMKFIRNKER